MAPVSGGSNLSGGGDMRRVSTADGRLMKQSSSCPRISAMPTSTGNKSVETPKRAILKVKSQHKSLKLKPVSQKHGSDDAKALVTQNKNTVQKQICQRMASVPSNEFQSLAAPEQNDKLPIKLAPQMSSIGPYDSVELSFMEKLAKAKQGQKKEMEDLATFEMLEDKLATNDSSICSSSSAIKKLLPVTQTGDKGKLS